ncbi:MAG: carboxylate-amine ligase [Rhodospirillales bacterium]|nr:carboxylate-amine ligase [Rhodospirillales bacterium]
MTESPETQDLAITLGVEEEFFLVDPDSRDLVADPDEGIFEACERSDGPHKVVHEFLRSQIETNTRVCVSVADVREALSETRRLVVEAAEAHGARVMAASTHPFASWREQAPTPGERYRRFASTYQESVRRALVGGMHIHAGFGDEDSRIRVMTALRRYLPFLHALSASSPFNGGHETGFKSFRLTVMGALPRTGLPSPLHSRAEYERLVAEYLRMDYIGDARELWWDIRPASAFPTIELRICDVCTHLEDAVSIAALYASLIRWLLRHDHDGALPPEPHTELIFQDRWIAQRYGVLAFFGDRASGSGRIDIDDYAAALVETLADDARALGCEAEVRRALTIVRDGTGADRQIDLYRLRRLEGDSEAKALHRVVDQVLAETTEGIGEGGG